jgi:hypothetical protein
LQFTHVVKQVEPDLWLNVVITHPETVYGAKKTSEEEAETIANSKFQSTLFQEEDSKLFKKVLEAYHMYFCMFHGSIARMYKEKVESDQFESF